MNGRSEDPSGTPPGGWRNAVGTNWETADVLSSPMEICWQFDYAIGIDKLRNLYAKSKQRQWDAARDIDWDVEVDPSRPIIDESQFLFDRLSVIQKLSPQKKEEFTAHMSCHLLSQFLHGEQGALMTAAALTHAVPDYEGKLYAATQTMDERATSRSTSATSTSSRSSIRSPPG
jgi:signal transduction histidine kinase